MDINQFMFRLNNELCKNSFYSIEVRNEYIKHDETYLIRVTAKTEYNEYDCDFEVNKECLDIISINEIVNYLRFLLFF